MTQQPSASHAIKLALAQKWDEAIDINEQLLTANPHDLDALKRIAYAYVQQGNVQKAKKYYQQILQLDDHNPIARKALSKLDGAKKFPSDMIQNSISTEGFLEEPGRTKVVNLINIAPNDILCHLATGQHVELIKKGRGLCVKLNDKIYLGTLPDDIAHRLIRLMSGGNEYNTRIKHVGKNQLSVFIREVRRGEQFINIPSFVNSIQSSYIPFVDKRLLDNEKPDTTTLEEEDEQSE